jgi:hypothetical protein
MARGRQRDIPMEMEKVYGRFERWRNSHQRGRRRIPEKLWKAAVETARTLGVFRTAKVLGLDYTKLKQMVGTVGTRERSLTKAAAFFELVPTGAAGLSECVIEIEGPRGKIRIQWKGITAPDLAGLSRTLWEPQ